MREGSDATAKARSTLPYRILRTLHDKPEIGSGVLNDVLVDTVTCLVRQTGSLEGVAREGGDGGGSSAVKEPGSARLHLALGPKERGPRVKRGQLKAELFFSANSLLSSLGSDALGHWLGEMIVRAFDDYRDCRHDDDDGKQSERDSRRETREETESRREGERAVEVGGERGGEWGEGVKEEEEGEVERHDRLTETLSVDSLLDAQHPAAPLTPSPEPAEGEGEEEEEEEEEGGGHQLHGPSLTSSLDLVNFLLSSLQLVSGYVCVCASVCVHMHVCVYVYLENCLFTIPLVSDHTCTCTMSFSAAHCS